MRQSKFQRGQHGQIRIHVLPTDRFKTFAISLFIGSPLREETVTKAALIPFILRRGTQSYPETKLFREHLDDLYGAGFGFDLYKRGDYQMMQFSLDMIEDQYVSETNSLLKQALNILGEVITKPAQEEGRFVQKYFDAEKSTVKQRLEAVVNDKIRYAAERCIQEMYKDDVYRFHPLGNLNEVDLLKNEDVFSFYKTWLQTSPIDLYVVGNTTLEEVQSYMEQSFSFDRTGNANYKMGHTKKEVEQVQSITESIDIQQGKLNFGLRTHTTYQDDTYPALLMYNGILGSYPHSKLFINVREKNSLAYYASSRMDGHKGLLTIQSGIEIDKFSQAKEIIEVQLDSMRQGDISEPELEQTKAMLVNQLREMQDSAFEMIAFDFNHVLSGVERSAEQLIQEIQQVNIAQIQEVANKIQLDTIYFLRNEEANQDE